jgi:creatinine amidohydrolase
MSVVRITAMRHDLPALEGVSAWRRRTAHVGPPPWHRGRAPLSAPDERATGAPESVEGSGHRDRGHVPRCDGGAGDEPAVAAAAAREPPPESPGEGRGVVRRDCRRTADRLGGSTRTMTVDGEHRYEKLTWPQVNEAVEDEQLVVIPVGSTEDHGPHLPLDVDQVLPGTICAETVAGRDDALLFPTVTHGYLPHHMDMPGGITIAWHRFVDHLIDVCASLVHHGFRKLLLVNGHGSNHHLVQQAARQVIVQHPGTHCAMLSWWQIDELQEAFREISDGGARGSGHAAELETSLYLHIDPDRVDMDEAVRDVSYPESDHFYATGLAADPDDVSTSVSMMEWWTTISRTGVKGDATLASAEKGERFLDEAVDGLHSILDELRAYPFREVDDHHDRDVSDDEYDVFRPR